MNYILPALQRYDWGSYTFIQNFLNLEDAGTIAEAWYSAHPKSPSLVNGKCFNRVIAEDPEYWLGKKDGELPYLLKILAARESLSIQVHPSKKQAEAGFDRENAQGIPLDAPNRNYRDRNHKPEMMLALTQFHALCGIREYNEIARIFAYFALGSFFESFAGFAQNPNAERFALLYREILSREPLTGLAEHIDKLSEKELWQDELSWCKKLLKLYPRDNSILSPLFLNLICLRPNEAIFLEAGIVHAYLEGSGIEIMASGDNVLRAGLSPKHIDVEELLLVMRNEPYQARIITGETKDGKLLNYPVPVDDFRLSLLQLSSSYTLSALPGARILLNLAGDCQITHQAETLKLKKGEAVIIPSAQQDLYLEGKAVLVMASSRL